MCAQLALFIAITNLTDQILYYIKSGVDQGFLESGLKQSDSFVGFRCQQVIDVSFGGLFDKRSVQSVFAESNQANLIAFLQIVKRNRAADQLHKFKQAEIICYVESVLGTEQPDDR